MATTESPQRRFRNNLRRIRTHLSLSWRAIANDCGFDDAGYKWLRRAAIIGISRRQRNNRERLDALSTFICKSFGRSPRTSSAAELCGLLWLPNVVESLQKLNDRPKIEASESAEMLKELLITGEYESLGNYVRDLYNERIAMAQSDHFK